MKFEVTVNKTPLTSDMNFKVREFPKGPLVFISYEKHTQNALKFTIHTVMEFFLQGKDTD